MNSREEEVGKYRMIDLREYVLYFFSVTLDLPGPIPFQRPHRYCRCHPHLPIQVQPPDPQVKV